MAEPRIANRRIWWRGPLFVLMAFYSVFQTNLLFRVNLQLENLDWQSGLPENDFPFSVPKQTARRRVSDVSDVSDDDYQERQGESLGSPSFSCVTRTGGSNSNSNSNSNSSMELGFLHIPKTGGSSVENAALSQTKTRWGYYAWDQKEWKNNIDKKFLSAKYKHVDFYFPHLPPSILQLVLTDTGIPYDGQDLFATIRNPFTRITSEVRYKCDMLMSKKLKNQCLRPKRVNRYLQNRFTGLLNATSELEPSTMNPRALEQFLKKAHHFVPQWHFFYDHFSGERQARYLLHFENLAEDFQDLMDSYSLNISLVTQKRQRQTNYSDAGSRKFRDENDFDESTRKLLVELYRKDFELGGYSMNISDTKSYSPPSHGVGPKGGTFWELPCRIGL